VSHGGLRIAFLGTAEFAVPALRLLAQGPNEIAAVFTRPDRPAGRGRRLRPSPVKLAAQELELPLLQPEGVSAGEGLEALRETSPDLIVVAAFGEIVTEEVLSVPRLGAMNLHASLLPRHRGAAPIQRALMAGETETGVTVQWMAVELDAGDIILQRRAAIGPEEDFGALHDRLAALGAEAAVESVDLVRAGTAPRTPQRHEEATQAPSIRREELVMDWERPAAALVNLIRALSPRPGARTSRAGELLKVLAAREGRKALAGAGLPGVVMEVTSEGFWVAAGDGRLQVERVQPAGRKIMAAGDYVKGYRLQHGERLGG
jgi:methionyl-tRNA formyltransferase